MSQREKLTLFIKSEAKNLGFDACGITPATALPAEIQQQYKQWIAKSHHASMHYMERNIDKRMDPTLLVPGAQSIIVVAFNYFHDSPLTHQTGIARYALNPDYHPYIRLKLQTLLQKINQIDPMVEGRVFADSAPVAERYWALQAGLGWIGNNNLLIIPGKGSWFLIGEIIISAKLYYDKPIASRCGTCTKCIDACPGKALTHQSGLNSNLCLSYLTIEKKGSFTEQENKLCGENGKLFGCDICQDVCPWNRFESEQTNPAFQLCPTFFRLNLKKLDQMQENTFVNEFKNTALFRTGLGSLKRNLKSIQDRSL